MPVVLPKADWATWLGEVPATPEELRGLLRPLQSDRLELWAIDKRVGNVKNDDAELVLPIKQTQN